MNEVSIERKIKITGEYDTVVCGGGPAGWIAAISAARAGCKVALVERHGFLGGTATASVVLPISAFYYKGRRVVGGIAWEFIQALEACGAAQVELPKGHISVNLEYYKLIAQRMVTESGVDLYTNTDLVDCITENGKILYAVISNKSGLALLKGKCFIDATGDGDLCRFAGVPMLEQKKPLQAVSLCFILEGVDTDTDLLRDCIHHDGKNGKGSCNQEIHEYLSSLYEAGKGPNFCGPWFNTLLKGKSLAVNITRTSVDATNAREFTRAETQLREDMFIIVEALRQKYKEFRDCAIVWSGLNAGVRETRHIKGVYTLTAEDFQQGRKFACPVAHCAHPMDIHLPDGGKQLLIPLEKDCFVPHTTMINREITNVIAAGRCVSVESEPYASVRIQGTVMCIGEAAGVMAGIYCREECPLPELDETILAKQLSERNFVL